MSYQTQLAKVVNDFFADRCHPDAVRAVEAGRGSAELWASIEDLGWTLPTLPEEQGGSEATFADACTIVQAAARHAAPLPLGETALIGAWLLQAVRLEVPAGPITVAPAALDDVIKGRHSSDTYVLDGIAHSVPWAPSATTLVVLANDESGAFLVAAVPSEAPGCLTDNRNLAGEPRSDVDFGNVELPVSAVAHAPPFITREAVMRRGALLRAVMMLGALERIRDLTIEHAKTRHQFGRPIGRFQAVAQHLALIARDVALARVAVESAIAATTDDDAPPVPEIAIAKVMCGRAACTVPRRAHQVHGAIGVTHEYALQLFTRRVWAWRDEFGDEFVWARALARAAAEADGGMWGLISSIKSKETNER
jgi:acyl-CoA dehydrogenase